MFENLGRFDLGAQRHMAGPLGSGRHRQIAHAADFIPSIFSGAKANEIPTYRTLGGDRSRVSGRSCHESAMPWVVYRAQHTPPWFVQAKSANIGMTNPRFFEGLSQDRLILDQSLASIPIRQLIQEFVDEPANEFSIARDFRTIERQQSCWNSQTTNRGIVLRVEWVRQCRVPKCRIDALVAQIQVFAVVPTGNVKRGQVTSADIAQPRVQFRMVDHKNLPLGFGPKRVQT